MWTHHAEPRAILLSACPLVHFILASYLQSLRTSVLQLHCRHSPQCSQCQVCLVLRKSGIVWPREPPMAHGLYWLDHSIIFDIIWIHLISFAIRDPYLVPTLTRATCQFALPSYWIEQTWNQQAWEKRCLSPEAFARAKQVGHHWETAPTFKCSKKFQTCIDKHNVTSSILTNMLICLYVFLMIFITIRPQTPGSSNKWKESPSARATSSSTGLTNLLLHIDNVQYK